jgi:hypothetical protein
LSISLRRSLVWNPLPDEGPHLALGHHSAPVDDGEPVAEPLGDLEYVGAHEHGPALRHVLAQVLPEGFLVDWIEVDERLVQEKELGLVDKRRGEHELLPHALGHVLAYCAFLALQVEHRQPFRDRAFQVIEDLPDEVQVLVAG